MLSWSDGPLTARRRTDTLGAAMTPRETWLTAFGVEHISSILPRVVAGLERRRPACWRCSQYGELRKEMVDGTDAVFWYCLSCRQRLVYDGRLYQPTDRMRMDEIEQVRSCPR